MEIYFTGFDRRDCRVLRSLIRPGKTRIDAGANIKKRRDCCPHIRTEILVVPQFELGNGTEDHAQQEREEAVVGDVIHAPKDCEDHKNELYPGWEFIYGP
jgi:hypothetical protein